MNEEKYHILLYLLFCYFILFFFFLYTFFCFIKNEKKKQLFPFSKKLFSTSLNSFFFFKEINLLIQISNIININTKSRVLKTLEDDATFMLVAKKIGSRPTYLIIEQTRFDLMIILY